MKAVLHPLAERELIDAAVWYEALSVGLGVSFIDEFERSMGAILANPETYPKTSGGARHFLMKKFPYRVIYTPETSQVYILALAHSKRRPGFWFGRQ